MKKLYRANYIIVYNIISAVFFEEKYSNKLIEKEFKYNKKVGARDRKFIAENIYDVVRWWRKLLYSCGYKLDGLRLSNLDEVLGTWFILNGYENPKFLELDIVKINRNLKKWNDSIDQPFSVQHSFCDDIAKKIQQEFGQKSQKIAEELNKKAPIYIRLNKKNSGVKNLIEELKVDGVEVTQDIRLESCFKLNYRANVFMTQAFKKGLFEVQDKGSQLIAPYLYVEPGMKVVDACAGAGGKSLHLADIMQNKGRIISLDIHQWKLNELKKRAKRNKVDIIETRVIDNNKVIKRLHEKMDRVLLDVPCSGFGVIKRNPDTKWKYSEQKMHELKELQQTIFQQYSRMVKPGGQLVYSTCSIFSEENDKQVSQFLSNNTDWELCEDKLVLPTSMQSDGFYMARLQKNKI